jgi:hypothetical protein
VTYTFELTAASLNVHAAELRAWRTGGYDLPNGIASALLDTERLLTETAKRFDLAGAVTGGGAAVTLARIADMCQARPDGGYPFFTSKFILDTITGAETDPA